MNRYSRNRFDHVMKSNRFRPVMIVLLIAIAAFLIFKLAGSGGLNEQNFENQRNSKLRSEIQHLVSQTSSLSRMGGTSTSAMLGRIRQYVHGVEVINDLNVSMYGEAGRLYQQSIFDNLYNIIDTFDAKLVSGQKVNESLATLNTAVDEINRFTTERVFGNEPSE